MYYEEKTIDGKIYVRTTPDGEWRLKPVDQTALIRELVGALERLKDSYRMSAPPLSRMDAWHEVDSTLAKVPEEYRG